MAGTDPEPADEDGDQGRCYYCGTDLRDVDPVQRSGHDERFCSTGCSDAYWSDPDAVDADDWRCGADTETTDGVCSMPVTNPGDRCHMHPRDGSGPPDGHGSGSPDRNELAAQRADGQGAPDGNRNAMSHGLYAAERDPLGLFDHFRENNPAIAEQIRRWFWSYMDDAPFDAYPGDADRYSPPVLDVVDVDRLEGQQDVADDAAGLDSVQVAQGPPRQQAAADAPPIDVQTLTGKAHRVFVISVHQAVLTNVTLRQAQELLSHTETIVSEGQVVVNPQTGDPVEVEEELPVNLPKGRIRQRDIRELKDLGILDDPESQKADAMASWGEAAERAAMRRDDTDELDR